MTNEVCCTIDNHDGCTWLKITASNNHRIINFQWEIILAGRVPGIQRLGYISSKDEHFWIADFSDSKSLSEIDAGNHVANLGIRRIQQIIGVLLKSEDYLFKNYQAYLNPEAIRFMVSKSALDSSPDIVFLPLDLKTAFEQYTLNMLIRQIAAAYEIPEKQTDSIIETYENYGLVRLDSMLAAECMNNTGDHSHRGKVISQERPQKLSDRLRCKGSPSEAEKSKYLWMYSHLFWLAVVLLLLFLPDLPIFLNNSVAMLGVMLIAGLCLAFHDIRAITSARKATDKNGLFVKAKAENTPVMPKRKNSISSKGRKIQLDFDVENQTEIVEKQDGSFRMAMMSQGLPGTPEELEGIRAFILLDEFIVGRDESTADLWLSSSTVGRRHARICRREGTFFITDLGSKNGTFLDGRRLNKNEESLLPDRCRLSFADQSYYFQVD